MSGKRTAQVARETDAAVAEAKRRALGSGEVVDAHTPLDALIQREEGESEEEFALKMAGARAVMRYQFADGPHPQGVMQRTYSLARAIDPSLTADMPGRALACIFGQTKQAESARTKLLISRTFEQAGYRVGHMPYQKSAGSSEVYAAAQLGNTHRKGTGKKSPKRKGARRR